MILIFIFVIGLFISVIAGIILGCADIGKNSEEIGKWLKEK